MSGLFSKFKGGSSVSDHSYPCPTFGLPVSLVIDCSCPSTDTWIVQSGTTTGVTSPSHKNKKDVEPEPEITPLVKMLQNAGPVKNDGSDKFFGMENVRLDFLLYEQFN